MILENVTGLLNDSQASTKIDICLFPFFAIAGHDTGSFAVTSI